MTGDLMELLQPHLEDPEGERRRQQEEAQEELEELKKEEEEERIRTEEMIEEIEKAATVMKKILQNSCSITIAKKMLDDDGGEGMVNAKLSVPRKGKGKIRVEFRGITFKDRSCLVKGLTTAMNQEEGLRKAFKKISYDLCCIKILHGFLSTDNVKVTYE